MTRDQQFAAGGASIFVLLGLFLFAAGLRNVWRGVSSEHWPKTTGVVAARASGVSIKYRVSDAEYVTSILHFGQPAKSGDVELMRARYPAQAEVTVWYQPDDPSVATTEPGFYNDALWLPGAGLGIFLSAMMFISLYLGISGDNRMFALGRGIFAGIIAVLGFLLLTAGLVNLSRGHASLSWPQTDGVITYGVISDSTSIITERSGDVFRAAPSGSHLIYRYELNGKNYYSNVRVFGQLPATGDWAAGIAALYSLGRVVSIAYSPQNPHLAVLQPGIDNEAFWLPGAGAAVLLFGLAILIWVSRRERRPVAKALEPSLP